MYMYICAYMYMITLCMQLHVKRTQSCKISGTLGRRMRCSSVLQCVAACCSALQRNGVCCSALRRVAVCCSALQCVAVFCSVL